MVLGFAGILSAYGLINNTNFTDIALLLGGNCLIICFVFFTALKNRQNPSKLGEFIYLLYPIALNIWFYPQACKFRFGFFENDLDWLVLKLESLLFKTDWFIVLPQTLSVFWMEFFHGIYFMYYLAIFIFPWMLLKDHKQSATLFIYTITLTMALHHVFIMIFPSSGPVHLRADLIPEGWLFIPVMNFIYGSLDAGGGGAFPSIHVAAAVVLCLFASSFFPKYRFLIVLFTLGILASTIVGAFHYASDVIAGIITGTISFILIPSTKEHLENRYA